MSGSIIEASEAMLIYTSCAWLNLFDVDFSFISLSVRPHQHQWYQNVKKGFG